MWRCGAVSGRNVRVVRPRRISLLVALAAVLAAPAAGAQAVPAQRAIELLNAQREANGIPGGIVENPDWSEGCARHDDYLARNPERWNSNPHDEDPADAGYTPEGQEAARNSVLSQGNGYADSADQNPWEDAPIHLMQLLAPALSVTGYADTPGACMWTWPGYQRPGPDPPVLYTYPGDGATIYSSMRSNEAPFSPGDFVGLSQSDATGPHLYVLAHGADQYAVRGRITAAALSGPDGPVDVRTVDNHTSGPRGDLGSYLPAGGIVIPVRPLAAGSEYTAQVTFATDQGAQLTRIWRFRTRAPAQSVSLRSRTVRRGRSFVLDYVAADDGKISFSLRRGGRSTVKGVIRVRAGTGFVKLRTSRPGRYTLSAVLKTSRSTRFRTTVRVASR